jgi:hypothetical protein
MEVLLEKALEAGHYKIVDGSVPLANSNARFQNGHLESFSIKRSIRTMFSCDGPTAIAGLSFFAASAGGKARHCTMHRKCC